MQIVFNIAEDSNVELVKGEYELVQGECCVTELKFNFPATIRGIAIANYEKRIEFGECKEIGECVKFIDEVKGNVYELNKRCTAFKKILVQLILTYDDIVWKTIPVALEFHESINAEGSAVIQAQILSFAAIKTEWENYIKAHTLRIIQKAADIPTADATSLGDTIFYLGANTDTAPFLMYGHYYKCNYVSGAYKWTDLTVDPSLAGVANGVREINKNQTLQFWKGTAAELGNETPQENVAYIAEDETIEDALEDIIVPNAMNAYVVAHRPLEHVSDVSSHIIQTGLYVVDIDVKKINSWTGSTENEYVSQASIFITDMTTPKRVYIAEGAYLEFVPMGYETLNGTYQEYGYLQLIGGNAEGIKSIYYIRTYEVKV